MLNKTVIALSMLASFALAMPVLADETAVAPSGGAAVAPVVSPQAVDKEKVHADKKAMHEERKKMHEEKMKMHEEKMKMRKEEHKEKMEMRKEHMDEMKAKKDAPVGQ